MNKNMRISIITLLFAAALTFSGYSQMVVSGGGNSYFGSTGLIFGGGLGLEYWLSLTEKRASEGLMMGFGLEYISLTTEITKTRGSGWIFPLTLKYGFNVNKKFNLGLGGGAAMVMNDADVEDYDGNYYVSSELGFAPFTEAGLTYFISSQFNLQIAFRGGELINEGGSYPFFGIKLYAGYYINLPEKSDESDY